ncbi:MAG: hypothetical protein IPP48_04205 [Chitinophagaceae bacterium]|nr:hypothetical protein [Chitinophagaceae bacterium]
MERRFYTDNFERFVKDKADEFKMIPSRRVWHSIYNDLHPSRKWPSIAMLLLLITSVLFIGYFNTNNTQEEALLNNEKNIVGTSIGTTKHSLTAGSANKISKPTTALNINTPLVNNINKNIVATKVKVSGSTTTHISTSSTITNSKKQNNKKSTATPEDMVTANVKPIRPSTVTNDTKITNLALQNIVAEKEVSDKEEALTIENIENRLARINFEAEKEVSEKKQVTQNISDKKQLDLASESKPFIEDFALQNKPKQKKWKGRSSMEFYATPSFSYRYLNPGPEYNASSSLLANNTFNNGLNHKLGFGLETGLGVSYTVAKNLRLKGGLQLNYTSYGVIADKIGHPVITTMMMTDPNSGAPSIAAATSTAANSSIYNPITLHNKTYQISIPLGAALKLSGNDKYEWFVGASLQPTYVFGGKANIISSDRKYYITDASLIGKWNLNSSVEAYVNYKFGDINFHAGPQLRYQLFSTYNNNLALTEKLYNIGFKVGIAKTF